MLVAFSFGIEAETTEAAIGEAKAISITSAATTEVEVAARTATVAGVMSDAAIAEDVTSPRPEKKSKCQIKVRIGGSWYYEQVEQKLIISSWFSHPFCIINKAINVLSSAKLLFSIENTYTSSLYFIILWPHA